MSDPRTVGEIFLDGMIKIVSEHIRRGQSTTFQMLKHYSSVRDEFETTYKLLVHDPINPLPPIEVSPKKLDYWTRVRKLDLPQPEKIKMAHALYMMEIINQRQ